MLIRTGLNVIKIKNYLCISLILIISGCGGVHNSTVSDAIVYDDNAGGFDYHIGAGDELQIFVWRNPDLSNTVPVRPDGKISSPLVEDLMASGKTPTQLAREIEAILEQYIRDPLVTVTVTHFVGGFEQQIRVIGEAAIPQALPYRASMSLLDVIIAVGGVTEFAGGNKAVIIRKENGSTSQINVRIDDLIKSGDISANILMKPGDIVVIPESLF